MRTNHPSGAARVLGALAGAIALVFSMASCAPNGFGTTTDSDADRTASGPSAATRAEQSAGAPLQGVATFTAADVARIVLVLEQADVARAHLAEDRAKTMEVKTYAARIAREQSEAMDRIAAILEHTSPGSEDPTPPVLERQVGLTQDWLGAEQTGFDLAFMTAQIAAHARVLGLLDMSLLPSSSRSPELEAELVVLRDATASQMVHALRVQGVLRASNAPVDETNAATPGGSTVARVR